MENSRYWIITSLILYIHVPRLSRFSETLWRGTRRNSVDCKVNAPSIRKPCCKWEPIPATPSPSPWFLLFATASRRQMIKGWLKIQYQSRNSYREMLKKNFKHNELLIMQLQHGDFLKNCMDIHIQIPQQKYQRKRNQVYPLSNTVRICSLAPSCSHPWSNARWLWYSWNCSWCWLAIKLCKIFEKEDGKYC